MNEELSTKQIEILDRFTILAMKVLNGYDEYIKSYKRHIKNQCYSGAYWSYQKIYRKHNWKEKLTEHEKQIETEFYQEFFKREIYVRDEFYKLAIKVLADYKKELIEFNEHWEKKEDKLAYMVYMEIYAKNDWDSKITKKEDEIEGNFYGKLR